MITISRRPLAIQGVEFQVGRGSLPGRPIIFGIDGVSDNLTTREAHDLASLGLKIRHLLHKAKKSGAPPADRRLMVGKLGGAEFAIGISSTGETPGVDLKFSGRTARFVDEDIAGFLGVLKQIDAALNEHRGAEPGGGVTQSQVSADDYFRWKHPELAWLYD